MEVRYYKEYSYNLNRDMEFNVYGHAGRPMLAFPSQNGRFFDFANNGLVEVAQEYIDSGRLQIFCCDSIDLESWSAEGADGRWRIENQEKYFHYIVDELCPMIFDINAECNGGNYANGIMTTGCSMGGTHSLNFMLRRPDIFDGCIAMDGAYDARIFFPDYFDDLVYANSPVDYIDGMPNDHYYVELYKKCNIHIVCGQGAWEHPMIEDTARMQELFGYKNIPANIHWWGTDISHDWPYWRMQFPYYLQFCCQRCLIGIFF